MSSAVAATTVTPRVLVIDNHDSFVYNLGSLAVEVSAAPGSDFSLEPYAANQHTDLFAEVTGHRVVVVVTPDDAAGAEPRAAVSA